MAILKARTKSSGLTVYKTVAKGSGSNKGDVELNYLFVAPVHADKSGHMVTSLPASWFFKVQFRKRKSRYAGHACTIRVTCQKNRADGGGKEFAHVFVTFKMLKHGQAFLSTLRRRLDGASWTTMSWMIERTKALKAKRVRVTGGSVE